MSRSGIPFVLKVPGSNNWHYRRDVPADVRKAVGVTRWTESLKSASIRDVAERARALAAKHDRLIAFHRRKDPLEALSPGDRKRVEDAGGVEEFLTWQRDRWRGANIAMHAADVVRSIPGDGADPAQVEAEANGLEATAHVLDTAIVADGSLLNQLGVALPPRLRKSVESSTDDITLRQIFNKWNTTKHAAEAQYRIPMELFEKKFGSIHVKKITIDQCREFRDHLASGAGSKRGKRADATSSKYFTAFKTLLTYAVNDGHLDFSPADKLAWRAEKLKHAERMEGKRRTFSPAETATILDALPGYAAESHEHDQVSWFVKIACYGGMRAEEIAQLAPGDVRKVGDVWTFQIHDVGDNSVKTRAGVRMVPIHARLLKDGLLAFVERRKGRERLFALCEKTDRRGRRYPPIYSRWTHFLRERLKMTDSKLCMHSWRHGMKDALRLAKIGEYEQDRILGHARKGREVQDSYGGGQLVVLNDAIQKADPLDQRRTVTMFSGGDDG